MEVDKIVICRLCLKVCQTGYENVDNSTQEALDFLLLDVNLDISHEPVVCSNCKGGLKRCFDFKADCLLKRNSTPMKYRNLDLNDRKPDLCVRIEKSASSVNSCDVCGFCMELVNLDSSVLLKKEEKGVISLLEKYFRELDLNTTEDSTTCTSCYKSLQILVGFINSCVAVEEKVKEYCNIEEMNSEGQIELNDMLNFTFKSQLKSLDDGFNLCKVKEECNQLVNFESKIEAEECELSYIKSEFGIKYEVVRSENGIEQDTNLYRTKSPTYYKCHTCSYKTYSKDRLQRHVLTHTNTRKKKLYACKLCTYQTRTNTSLRLHMLTHKNVSEVKIHKCESCAYETKYKHCLQKHIPCHKGATDVKRHKCEVCPFRTKHEHCLGNHMAIHRNALGVTVFKCDVCSYQSKHKGSLKTHMLLHKSASKVTMHKNILNHMRHSFDLAGKATVPLDV